eukprot:gene21438-6745_t
MLPSANVAVNAPPILTEWLFNQGASPPSDECTLPDKIIVDGTLGDCTVVTSTTATTATKMSRDAGLGNSESSCTIMDVPSTWNPAAFWSLYSGPLSVASNLAEWVELMYLNNLDYKALVGEGVTETEIASLYQVHQTNLDITADDIWTARSFGSDLLAHIAQLFSGGSYSNNGILSRPTDKIIFFESQSYSQQRSASPLGGDAGVPDRVFVAIPRCAMGPEGSCPFDVFKEIAGLALDARC